MASTMVRTSRPSVFFLLEQFVDIGPLLINREEQGLDADRGVGILECLQARGE